MVTYQSIRGITLTDTLYDFKYNHNNTRRNSMKVQIFIFPFVGKRDVKCLYQSIRTL